jgi:hypothetical protein
MVNLLILFIAVRGANVAPDRGSAGQPACSPDAIDIVAWQSLIEKPRSDWSDYFATVKACVANSAAYRSALDTAAVGFMVSYRLVRVAPSLRQAWRDFVAQILLINAEAGFASSQHNYAVLHNAAAGDPMRQYVEQSYQTFMLWSCRAAEQKYPRAIFNVALRAAEDAAEDKIPYVVQNPRIAYHLLKRALANCRIYPELANTRPFVESALKRVKQRLTPREIKQLDRERDTFDFSTLCTVNPDSSQ